MADRPLISVVTGTRNRHEAVQNALGEVRRQTYRPLEHVIVADGPDPVLRKLLAGEGHNAYYHGVPIVFQETGRVWSDELARSTSAVPFMVAQFLARGTLQMWLSDDEEMEPDHIEALYDLMEESHSDFTYSRAEWWVPGRPALNRVIGTVPPTPDQLTNVLYRTALLDYGHFRPGVGRGTDWDQVGRWIEAGASYDMLDRITFRHRADQVGGVDPVTQCQPLRGWIPRRGARNTQ